MPPKSQLPTLLLIADNPAVAHWIRKNLEGRFLLIQAATAENALQTIRLTALDFIILDSNFEESNALSLSHKARQINTVIPIILLTGRLKKTFQEEALKAGVTDFLNDQLDLDELETRLATDRKESP